MLWAAGSWSWPRCWLFPDSPWGRSIPVYCRLPALCPRDQLGVEESESWVAPCVFSHSRGNLEVLGDYSSPPLLNIGFSRRQGGRSLGRPRCHLIPGLAHSAHMPPLQDPIWLHSALAVTFDPSALSGRPRSCLSGPIHKNSCWDTGCSWIEIPVLWRWSEAFPPKPKAFLFFLYVF